MVEEANSGRGFVVVAHRGQDHLIHLALRNLFRRLRTWLRFKGQEITLPIMINALEIKVRHELSYWDAAIVAAARALGCRELLSEDMNHGREVEDVTINNPFR
jgi:predicted nucleic acid-binding protein